MKNWKMSTRLVAGFGLMVLLLATVTAVGLMRMSTMWRSTEDITTNWLPSVSVLGRMNTATSDFRVLEFQHVLNTDDAAMRAIERRMADELARFDAGQQAYVKMISSPEESQLFASFSADWKRYMQLHEQFLVLSRKNDNVVAKNLLEGDSQKLFDSSSSTLDQLIALNGKGGTAAANEAEVAHDAAVATLIAFSLLGLAVALGVATWLIRSITGPLNTAVAAIERVAAGDLSVPVRSDSADEIGLLLRALQRMQDSLTQVVANVRRGADGVATGSSEIAQGNIDLSGRTEQQASALEETAASMEQLSSTVRQNADNARQANELATSASTIAVQGGAVVDQVVTTMREINHSSKNIAEIVSLIDGIAFQTNILALNAAVEAARAGEQGRGFAVVASEVRSLSQRSASAAKEIKALIDSSVLQVDQGTALVARAGATMTEVVTSIRRVSEIIGEVSAASMEQSQGVAQVGEAIAQIDQVTQQNAALVEESAAAAGSLSTQAQELLASVAAFKLGGALATPPSASSPLPTRVVVRSNTRRPPAPGAEAPTRSPDRRVAATTAAGVDDAGWASF